MKEFLKSNNLEERVAQLQKGLDYFKRDYKHVTYINEAAFKIGGVYYKILKKYVKPLIPKRVNKFKMGALIALTTVKLQPIQNDSEGKEFSEKEKRELNAELGFFLAMNIIIDMAYPKDGHKITGLNLIDDTISSVKTQHLNFLKIKELDSFPIFPIASFYYCFFVILQSKYLAISN